MTDPATSLCKRLFLAHYFPSPTGLVTIRKLRNRFIVTATVAGVPTRRVYPSDLTELRILFALSETKVYYNSD